MADKVNAVHTLRVRDRVYTSHQRGFLVAEMYFPDHMGTGTLRKRFLFVIVPPVHAGKFPFLMHFQRTGWEDKMYSPHVYLSAIKKKRLS